MTALNVRRDEFTAQHEKLAGPQPSAQGHSDIQLDFCQTSPPIQLHSVASTALSPVRPIFSLIATVPLFTRKTQRPTNLLKKNMRRCRIQLMKDRSELG